MRFLAYRVGGRPLPQDYKAPAEEEKSRKAEEQFRKLAVEELAHRLKNKIATIQFVISLQLRDNPETRDAIIGRLSALSPPTILS